MAIFRKFLSRIRGVGDVTRSQATVENGERYVLFADPAGQADRTDIGITFKPDGALVIDGCYSGPIAERMYGDWDHEFWLTIPARDAPRFMALVLARAFHEEGRLSYAELDELCREAGIAAERASYS